MKTTIQNDKATAVIFRTFHSGDVIALFPLIASDVYGHHCESYQHIGQHGGASPELMRHGTRASTADEIAPLREELTRIGYTLREIKRFPRNAFETRMATIRTK